VVHLTQIANGSLARLIKQMFPENGQNPDNREAQDNLETGKSTLNLFTTAF